MKKFSAISGEKVTNLPEAQIDKSKLKKEALKADIIELMNNFLTIQSYGSLRRSQILDNVKISGKEIFAEALIDYLSNESLKEGIKTLESLKSFNKDWQSIDERIEDMNIKISSKMSEKELNQANKIKTLIESYGDDDNFDSIVELYTNRIKNHSEAHSRGITACKMMEGEMWSNCSKVQLSLVSEKFFDRAKSLDSQCQ